VKRRRIIQIVAAIAVYMAIEVLKINLLWVSSEARSVSSSARCSAAGHGRSGSSLNSW